MDLNLLTKELTLDEGLELKPYQCTANKVTIGIGRNLTDVGITEEEAEYLLGNDIREVISGLNMNFPWWKDMPETAQRGLANMAFNMGIPRLKGFKNMLKHLKEGKFPDAAAEALNSVWASQVGERSKRVARLIRDARNG
jgi:lysozyme